MYIIYIYMYIYIYIHTCLSMVPIPSLFFCTSALDGHPQRHFYFFEFIWYPKFHDVTTPSSPTPPLCRHSPLFCLFSIPLLYCY